MTDLRKMSNEAINERTQLADASQKELCAEISLAEDGEFGLGLFDVLQEMYNAGYARGAAPAEEMKPRCPKCGSDALELWVEEVGETVKVTCLKKPHGFLIQSVNDFAQFFALSPARSGEPPKNERQAVEDWFKLPDHDLGFKHRSDLCEGTNIIDATCVYCLIITAMAAYKSWAARPSEPSAPQTSAEPSCNELLDRIHTGMTTIIDDKKFIAGLEAIDTLRKRFAAPQPVSGAAPKVEEIAAKLAEAFRDWRDGKGYETCKTPDDVYATILRPYFPLASQTPSFSQLVSIWPAINRFRGQLIDRKVSGRLENGDRDILDALQVFADWYLEAVVPRDTSVLEKLEQLLATPASTARTDAQEQAEALLKSVDELLTWASTHEKWSDLHEELTMQAAYFRNSGLKQFAAPGSVPQAPVAANTRCSEHKVFHPACADCWKEYYKSPAFGVPQAEPKEEK